MPEKEKVLLLIVESRDVCSLYPESSETISNKENSTEKHPERQSSLLGSDDVTTPQTGDSYSFSSVELTCINLPFTATKGDTVLLLHV